MSQQPDQTDPSPPPTARDRTGTLVFPSGEGAGAAYLLLLEGGTSSVFHLPPAGSVIVGRGSDVDLRLRDRAASRRHARITVAGPSVVVADLDSHNGTLVNGARLEGSLGLASGDAITIGETALVLHRGSAPRAGVAPLELGAFRARFEEECARSLASGRPLGVAVLALGARGDRAAARAALADALGSLDVLGADGEAELLVLMPERAESEASAAAARLLAAARARAPEAALGLAGLPSDGCDADALVGGARDAARASSGGGVSHARDAVTRIALGDRPLVIADPAMRRLYDLIGRLAQSPLPVLVCGETGAGKEHAAFAIHHGLARASGPFVALNCAALPETLAESELFGHERGAFSGATAPKPGLFERASGGTLFFDEIGELSPAVQAKLLRALEVQRITRVGGTREIALDLRIVAATNRDLEAEVRAGRFREDLYFRLGAATVTLPPLRDRPREIAILARAFVAEASQRARRTAPSLSEATLRALSAHAWPGNVRELRNAMEYASATAAGDRIEPAHLPSRIVAAPVSAPAAAASPVAVPPAPAPTIATTPEPPSRAGAPRFQPLADELRELERRRILEALEATGGVRNRAAKLLGLPLRTFVYKLRLHRIGKE